MKNTIVNSTPLIAKLKTKSKLSNLCYDLMHHFSFKFLSFAVQVYYTYLLIARSAYDTEKQKLMNYHQRLGLLAFFFLEFLIYLKALS